VHVGVGHPLLALDRRESADVGDPARGLQVVEDRLVAREALEAEHLFDEEPAGLLVTELHVPLGWDGAPLDVAHRLEVPPQLLLTLDRLEERLEVPLAEAAGRRGAR
jgi:hypothetical protein